MGQLTIMARSTMLTLIRTASILMLSCLVLACHKKPTGATTGDGIPVDMNRAANVQDAPVANMV